MQKQITKIGERATCAECGRALVYGSAGWLHVRQPNKPHVATPGSNLTLVEDTLTKALERVVELEEVVKVQGDRIQVLLAANRELSEKVRK